MVDIKIGLVLLFVAGSAGAFPSGAPVEACDSLLPRHIHTTPKNSSESPFTFTASASRYFPDSKRRKIKVRIDGAPFRGFFVVALDAETHQHVGRFEEARGLEPVPCAAATHADRRPKVGATLLWKPPSARKKGRVIFLATILESFSSYYTGLLASVPSKRRRKKAHKKEPDDTFRNSTLLSLSVDGLS